MTREMVRNAREYLRRTSIVWFTATMGMFGVAGCTERRLGSEDAVLDERVARYFLVSLRDDDISRVDIYVIDTPDEVTTVGRWIDQHVDSSDAVQKGRGLVRLRWHDELLRFNENGRVISSDFLADPDVISQKDFSTLKLLFQEHGKMANTVPGRRPPRGSGNPNEQQVIENDGE